MEKIIKFLNYHKIEYKLNESLKKYNTWKIGGKADILINIDFINDLKLIFPFIIENNIPYLIIGKGSNLLIKDNGFRGVVIKLGKEFDFINFNNNIIEVGGSVSIIRLSLLSAKNGLSGFEFAGGIPGTVGGAICMNAGAHGSDISNILLDVTILNSNGQLVKYAKEQLELTYRNSIINNKDMIVLSATFQLKKSDPKIIAKITSEYKKKRFDSQPLKSPSCGSVFKNPLPNFAGQLIESAGLKGFRYGDAQISTLHSNFIINIGNAKASDILFIIKHVQETILDKYNISLIPEVKIIGD